MPRKKRRLIYTIITISIILILVAIAGIVYYLYMNTDMFKSNQTLFKKYLIQNFEIANNWIQNDESTVDLKENKYTSSSEIGINYISDIGTSAESRDNSINKAKLLVESQTDDKNQYQYSNIKLQSEDNELAAFEYLKNDDLLGIRLEGIKQFVTEKDNLTDLSQKLEIPFEDLQKIMIAKEIPELSQFVQFSEDEKNILKETYLSILEQNTDKNNYGKETKTITSSDTTITVTGYYTTMTKEKYNNIKIAILEKLKSDEIILSKIDNIESEFNKYGISLEKDGKKLREQLIKGIEKNIEDIKNSNIGNEEVKIEVYVNNGKTLKTEITTEGYSFSINTNENNIEMEEIDDTSNVQKRNVVKLNKQSDDTNQNTEIGITLYENGVQVKDIQLKNSQKTENDQQITGNIEIGYKDEENELNITINNNVKIVDDLKDKIELNDDNNILLDNLDENAANNVINILKEQIKAEEDNIFSVISLDDTNKMLKNLGIIKEDIIRDEPVEITETERNRFNSTLTFFIGKEKPLTEVQELLENVKVNFKDGTIIKQKKKETDKEEKLTEIDLDIERGTQNDNKLQEISNEIQKEENKNLKYDITMGYDEQTKLINKIYIKVSEN